jgi:argininosuccinate lyase
VALAEKKGKRLSELQLAELRSIHPAFTEDAPQLFDLKKALAQRSIVGAPGPAEIRKQLARWTKQKP